MSALTRTAEQEAIIAAAKALVDPQLRVQRTIKVEAGAGTGKTTLLRWATAEMKASAPKAKVLYLAYNKAIATEAKHAFSGTADCFTLNGLALRNSRPRSRSRKLGNIYATDVQTVLGKQVDSGSARSVLRTMTRFLHSGDAWVLPKHAPASLNGRSVPPDERAWLSSQAGLLFMALTPDQESSLPLPHDVYLKYWQLCGSPGLHEYDLVLLDESQDAAPVMLSALDGAGNAMYVGDSHQSIYGYRGAINAMEHVTGSTYPLTQSFRFGPEIAGLANRVLQQKSVLPQFSVRGFQRLDTRIGKVERGMPHTRIFRTNRHLIREALVLHDRGTPFAIAGDYTDVSRLIDSIRWLRLGEPARVRHPLVRRFKTWDSIYDFALSGDESQELAQGVRLVDEFTGRVDDIRNMLGSSIPEDSADVVLTTAHRSKGREWDNVTIAPDFDEVLQRARASHRAWDAEMNLIYVSVTRAMRRIELNSHWLREINRNGPL